MRLQRTVVVGRIAPGLVIIGDLPKVQLGTAYSFTFSVIGGSGKIVITEAGALAAGITFHDNGDGTCTIAGTTTVSGTWPFTLTAVDLVNGYTTGAIAYLLEAPPLTLQLLESAPVIRGIAVSGLALFASGGYGGYTYPAYTLPTGLSVNAIGTIIGTCTDTVGQHACSAQVRDSFGATKTITFKLDVQSRLKPVNVTPPQMEVGVAVAYPLSVSGATGAVTWAVTSGALPGGESITGGNTLSGAPTTAGTYNSTITATDAGTGDTLPVALALVVNQHVAGNFKSAPEYVLSAGTNYPQLPLAADVAGGLAAVFGVAPYTYTFDAAYAPGIVVDANTGFLSGTPTTPRPAYWGPAGSLTTARNNQSASLLASGKVLVSGGYDGVFNLPLTGAERYDPVANTWSPAGALALGRYQHTSTTLSAGDVLVTGGTGGGPPIASCERYNAGTNTWGAAAAFTARFAHTATLLNSGLVLVTGGNDAGGPIATCQLYNPLTNTWSAAGSMATARSTHTVVLLASGKVLACGGFGVGSAYLASCEIYDPVANTWSAAGSMAAGRYAHTSSLLNSGKVLSCGGLTAPGTVVLASCEIYDPAANTWSAAAPMSTPRFVHAASTILSGEVVVSGGNAGIGAFFTNTVEVYNPISNTWGSAGAMTFKRAAHNSILLNTGNVLLVAGAAVPAFPAVAELYTPGLKITVTDAVGATAIQYVALAVNRPNPALQQKFNNNSVGATSTSITNYTGSGVSDVTNDGTNANIVLIPYAVAAGTNTYTATLSPPPLQYATNATYKIKFTNANTAGSTLNLNGLGAAAIQLKGSALAAGQIPAGSTLDVFYDGVNFQIVGVPGLGGTVTSVTATAPLTSTGGVTPNLAMGAASGAAAGYLMAADWTTFNGKQAAITFSSFGAVPNTAGLSIVGGVITMQPADATHPGGLTFSDWNTFNNKQQLISFGLFGSSPNSNGATIAGGTITMQPADATRPGGVNAGTQSFGGVKTFNAGAASGAIFGVTTSSGSNSWITLITNGVVTNFGHDGTNPYLFNSSSAFRFYQDAIVSGKIIPSYVKTNGVQTFPGAASAGISYFYNDTTLGTVIYGFGSAADITIANRSGTAVITVLANTTTTRLGGALDINTAGAGLQVAEGSNAKQGTAVLVAGIKVVANTSVTANSRIFLTSNVDGGTPGFVRVSARTAGTSFTITSSNAADTSTIAYEIFEPG